MKTLNQSTITANFNAALTSANLATNQNFYILNVEDHVVYQSNDNVNLNEEYKLYFFNGTKILPLEGKLEQTADFKRVEINDLITLAPEIWVKNNDKYLHYSMPAKSDKSDAVYGGKTVYLYDIDKFGSIEDIRKEKNLSLALNTKQIALFAEYQKSLKLYLTILGIDVDDIMQLFKQDIVTMIYAAEQTRLAKYEKKDNATTSKTKLLQQQNEMLQQQIKEMQEQLKKLGLL